jgi:outer membrane protein OmpA-like peptidoglycan-associated protein
MKTKIFLMSLLVSFSFYALAQEAPQTAGYKTAFKHNSAGSNWFIGIGAGAQTYLGDHDSEADLTDRFTVVPTLTVGKWFSPYWGARIKGQGGSLHGFEPATGSALWMEHIRYYNVHVDAMWNLANYWGVYSPTKLFSFIPYVGLGYAHKLQFDDPIPAKYYKTARTSEALSVNGGIQFGFRLSNRVNLDFDLGVGVVPDYFDGIVQHRANEAIATATGGLTFKLGKTDFEVVEPMDYALIDDLNNKINSLRAENAQLSKRPVSCPECPPVAAPIVKNDINYVPNVVFFRLNSSKIDENQKISVYNTSEFIKNTGEKIKVIGYADKNTGTSKYNLTLSEKRAKAVAKELTSKYNIPSEKIVVEWKGASEQPYQQNNWNRVVIMSAQ